MSSLKSDLLLPSILQNINKIGVLVHNNSSIVTVPGKPQKVHRNLNSPSPWLTSLGWVILGPVFLLAVWMCVHVTHIVTSTHTVNAGTPKFALNAFSKSCSYLQTSRRLESLKSTKQLPGKGAKAPESKQKWQGCLQLTEITWHFSHR